MIKMTLDPQIPIVQSVSCEKCKRLIPIRSKFLTLKCEVSMINTNAYFKEDEGNINKAIIFSEVPIVFCNKECMTGFLNDKLTKESY